MTSVADPNVRAGSSPRASVLAFARDIKLAHSVFAMPFAVLALFMAAKAATPSGLPTIFQVGLIVLCMVAARSFAMGMNRLIDASGDALNPRTARRAIPSGALSRNAALIIVVACAFAFELVTLGFGFLYGNWLPSHLAIPVLAALGAYPFFKRFTRWCHVYLGFCLALAPVCAWVAIAGTIALTPLILAAAVLCWTAGFDVIYATQDLASDRATGTFSLPAAVGVGRALLLARVAHAICIALLIALGLHSLELATLWFVAVGIVAVVFTGEHAILSPTDLSRVNLAFFTLNGIVSLCLGTLGVIDVLI